MDTAIVVALIASGTSIIASILSVVSVRISNKQQEDVILQDLSTQLQKYQAISDLKLENLANEVKKHNNFAQRVPVIEEKVKNLEDDIKELRKPAS